MGKNDNFIVTGYSNHVFSVKVPFSEKDIIKYDFNGKFNWDTKEWLIHEVVFARFAKRFKNRLVISDNARSEWERFEKALKLKEQDDALLDSVPFSDKLRPYQRVGAAFLSTEGSKILADEMGLGKSVQTVATAINLRARKILIVSPNPLKQSWKEEIAKWTDKYKIFVAGGSKSKRVRILSEFTEGFLIVNYEMLLSESYRNILSKIYFDLIAADESTFLKNRKAKRTSLFKELHGQKKIFITGTPVTKTPADLFAPLNLMFPYYYNNFWAFAKKYCFVDEINIAGRKIFKVYGVQNEDELKRELQGILIRRTKKEVATTLPPLIEEEAVLDYDEMPQEQKKAYEETASFLETAVQEHNRKDILKYFVYMQEILETPQNIGIDAPSLKMTALRQILNTYYAEDKTFIIWTQYVKTAYVAYDIAKKMFGIGRTAVITGKEKNRNKSIAMFQNGKIDALVITLKTGKFGFNLTVPGKNVISIFVSRSFDFEEMEQAKQRVLRLTTEKSPTVLYLTIPDTIDGVVKESLLEKKDIFNVLLAKR